MFRKVSVLTLAAVVTLVTAAPPAEAASEDSDFVGRINRARGNAGLEALEVYWDLTDDARSHTSAMVEAGEIFHSSNLGGVTSGWWALGENVGVGGDVAGLHEAFMASPPHRSNVLGDFNYVGVGTQVSDDGYLYVTVIFMKGPEGLVSPPAEEENQEASSPAEQSQPAEEFQPAQEEPAQKSARSEPSRPAEQIRSAEPIPKKGWLTELILDLVAAGQWPCVLPGGLALF